MLSREEIKRVALEVGFEACGVARAERLSDEEYPLKEWIERGWNGELGYMERNMEKRMDPRLLVEGAKSVICCVSAYPPPDNTGGTAAYALTRDYHIDIKQMLFEMRERLKIEGKCCCDTVPISDKHWAARAGLGWIGRHTLLVTPQWGSWVNLGEIVTVEECDEYDTPLLSVERTEMCKNCGRCIAACPNRALASEGAPMLDVRRCTSYYTTHQKRPIPEGLDTKGYTQGCDLCQMACPYNKKRDKKETNSINSIKSIT